MKLRKRYILLILLALLPFYKLYHKEDYCFGDVDLVIIGGLTLIFIITFLAIFFYNLYKITIKKELFNFTPLIITAVFAVVFNRALEYHDKAIFKDKVQIFNSFSKEKALLEIILFDDATFEFKTIYENSYCVEKGTYEYKMDSLFFYKTNKIDGNIVFGDVYIYNKVNQRLNPIYTGLPNFTLKN
ncbi:hypothetical protein [Polaribacter sp. Asnod6-C07]|uniref:hypothetical protein n=1 Tax=Polaribacter sp. Asnod6-C07 TaxID=3160582 RepID=UPI003867E05F